LGILIDELHIPGGRRFARRIIPEFDSFITLKPRQSDDSPLALGGPVEVFMCLNIISKKAISKRRNFLTPAFRDQHIAARFLQILQIVRSKGEYLFVRRQGCPKYSIPGFSSPGMNGTRNIVEANPLLEPKLRTSARGAVSLLTTIKHYIINYKGNHKGG
jgi:hypothetical protein